MIPTITSKLDSVSRYGLIILAVIQGYALYFLHLAVDNELWPATDPRWMFLFYSMAIGVPLFYYLGLERLTDRRNAWVLGPLLLLLGVLGWHLGWLNWDAALPGPTRGYFGFVLTVSTVVTLFILALFFRVWCINQQARFDYRQLLELSWQNALTLVQLWLFIAVFWGLLLLWAGLFKVIDIDFFSELFEELLFVYPVTALVGGWGLVLIRERIRLIATVQAMCEGLTKALLPLAALIMVLFLAALPFTGLERIWETGHAALLMMWLALILLFFFNSALSENPDKPPYPVWLRTLVYLAVALLPFNSLLAAWALGLRIEQYGLTVDRLWAATLQLLIAGFTVSYAVLVVWKRSHALASIQRTNKVMALVMATVLVLINTPVADLRAWAAASQAGRLEAGKVSVEDFDYAYLRFDLAAYGVRELRRLRDSDFAAANPAVVGRIDAILLQESRWQDTPVVDVDDPVAVADMFAVVPAGTELPQPLLSLLADNQTSCLSMPQECTVIQVPLEAGRTYWMVAEGGLKNYVHGSVYLQEGERVSDMGALQGAGCVESGTWELTGDERLVPVEPHSDVFTDGECFFLVRPSTDYLKSLLVQPVGAAQMEEGGQ